MKENNGFKHSALCPPRNLERNFPGYSADISINKFYVNYVLKPDVLLVMLSVLFTCACRTKCGLVYEVKDEG